MDINILINKLLAYGRQNKLITDDDVVYSSNLLLDLLGITEFKRIDIHENINDVQAILDAIMLTIHPEIDSRTEMDLLDTRIMNCIMPRPNEVIKTFTNLYKKSKIEATNYYYALSIASNYIRKDRIEKNLVWKTKTDYGFLDVTINLSKPEKDPRDIAKAKSLKPSGYPKCLLCRENEGYAGNINHPARQTHRLIPMNFEGRSWYMQYSPYTYYNEHCILLKKEHEPMKICRDTFQNLLDFVEYLPHYFLGSNADLPIVGGSILSHDHYQGGHYTFAMEKAEIEEYYTISGFENLRIGRVKWPMSVIRVNGEKKEDVINFADYLLNKWRDYSDSEQNILAKTDSEPHNTVTPIARMRSGKYEIDLVLRNNRTSKEFPLGIFHPHNEVHHIKKENIGLIEVMGLAVLPARLKEELEYIKSSLILKKANLLNTSIAYHDDWYQTLLSKYENNPDIDIDILLKVEVGLIFLKVLEHAGVFKRNSKGFKGFNKFINSL